MAARVSKPSVYKAPKVSVPKPKQPKPLSMTTKPPKAPSMSGYSSSSKQQNGLKGAISKYQLAQMNAANLNQSV